MSKGFRLTAATALHQGDRPYQQDQLLLQSHPRIPGCVLGLVADGMGGRSGGRKASDQVLMTAQQLFARYAPGEEAPGALLTRIVEDAHTVIKLTAVASEQEPHSTVAAFLLDPSGAGAWAHAGDSRIYHFRKGRMVARTRDHSYVEALVERGELSEHEAMLHQQANILIGCLGMRSTPAPIDIHAFEAMGPGDALLACSDGFWHYFTPEEMGAVIADQSPRAAAELLVEEARQRARGGGDNLSLVIVKFEPLPRPALAG